MGLSGSVLINVTAVVFQNTVGWTIQGDGFQWLVGIFMVTGFCLCVTSHASIKFVRQVRLIRQPSTKKKHIAGQGGLFSSVIGFSRVAAAG